MVVRNMAAKLLHSLTDDNPDLQKQIGCMTGIFQLFDRQNIIAGRRIVGHSHKRLPPGMSNFNNGSLEGSNNAYRRQPTMEMNSNKNVNEKRVSTESSRASFSSSSCSSLSSLDCNRTSQPEPSSSDRNFFPETPSRDPAFNQSSGSPNLVRKFLDLRDVVKDSMYREARSLSVKTPSKEEAISQNVKHGDSPRPLQLTKSVNGSYGVGTNGKQNTPVDLKESIRVLAKLREAPWHFNESRDFSRSAYDAKDGSLHTISKDAPRFSYDGRETNRLSFESRETLRSTPKLKELPRLSLDSRDGSMQSFKSELQSNALSKKGPDCSIDKFQALQQASGSQKRPPSVVAKLMGLEALPDSTSASDSQMGLVKDRPVEDYDLFLRSSTTTNLSRPMQISDSARNSWKGPTSPRWQNPDSVMKPLSSSRFPIEPAPWKQLDASRGSLKPASRHLKTTERASDTFPSVYSEIEKRLKDLEFKQSGKDLRALKQILEAMQAKGLLDTEKEEQSSNFASPNEYERKFIGQNSRLVNQRNTQSDCSDIPTLRGANSPRTFESPIVIMKPTKLVQRSGILTSSVIPVHGLSSLNKLQVDDFADSTRSLVNGRIAKDQTSKNSRRDLDVSCTDKKANGRNSRSAQSFSKPQRLPKENTTNSVKSSGSISPRMQQKKLELEKRSRPPSPSSDTSKSRRQPNRQPTESGSPGGKLRPKFSNLQQQGGDDHLSEISNESRNLSYQGDDISLPSDSNMPLDLKVDIEVTCLRQCTEINGSQSPTMKVVKQPLPELMQKKSTPRFCKDGLLAELATDAPEHPSPVSVLDASVYRDDSPSPVKQIVNSLKDDGALNISGNCGEENSKAVDNIFSNSVGSGLTSEINRKKLQSIENLVQKLRRLNSNHDEASTDYIASLCDNTNPDHRYISEILLASGLLLRDLGSSLTTFQLHPSGQPINPELFFVLEQTKASTVLLKEEHVPGKLGQSNPDKEKAHRKLIFDAVNEVLVKKLASLGPSNEPWLKPSKLARKTMNAQKLLRELCSEIEQLQINKSQCNLEEEDDGLKRILSEDVMHRSESWTGFDGDMSGLVLDVERFLFKELVDEIVLGEAANLRTRPGRRCRKLFVK